MGLAARPYLRALGFCNHGCKVSGSRRLLEQFLGDSRAVLLPDHLTHFITSCSVWSGRVVNHDASSHLPSSLGQKWNLCSTFTLYLLVFFFLFLFFFLNNHFPLRLPEEMWDTKCRCITEQKWKSICYGSFWKMADSLFLILSTTGPQSKTRCLWAYSYCCMFTEGKYAEVSSFKGSL